MKKLFLKSFALVAMLLCGLTASAEPKQYCAEEVTPTAGETTNQTLVFTASKTGDMETTFTLTSTTSTLTGLYEAVFQVSGGGVVSSADENYWKDWTLSDNTLTKVVTWSTYPTAAIQLHLVARRDYSKGGSDIIGYTFTDIDVSKTCSTGSGEEKETIKPTMTSASLVEESVTYNSVVIKVAGTDKETKEGDDVAVTRFKVLETSKTYTATDGKITITGLTPGTTYSFTIYAVDAAGNVSEEGLKVEATTENRASQCSGECGHFGNPTVKRIAYIIAYDPTEKVVVYTISALNKKKLDFMEVNTTKGNYRVDIPTNDSTTCTFKQTGLTEGEEMGIRFLYSTDEIGGNEMTALEVSMSDPNIIYYKVGDCAMVIEEDTEAPVMVSATLESNTYNSAVIAVKATDNKGVVSYNVVDKANAFDANFAAVDGKITVTGLTPNTTYNLAISAVDLAGNVSAEAKTVQVITPTFAHPSSTTVPMHASSDVFSIYSDAYKSTVTRATGGWGQQTKEQEVALAEGDNAFYYTNGNYLGWELNNNVTIGDMSLFPNLHMDIYVAEAGTIKFTPIWGAEAAKEYTLVAGWNALDIELAADFASINLKNIYQLKWDAMPAVCYIDNVYFWKDGASTAIDATEVAPKVTKTIENGQLVIIRDGVKYNVVGSVIEK